LTNYSYRISQILLQAHLIFELAKKRHQISISTYYQLFHEEGFWYFSRKSDWNFT